MNRADLKKDADRRLANCRKQFDAFRDDIEEAYFFVAPRRTREVRDANTTRNLTDRQAGDADLLQISIGMECAEDFATTLIASFMPKGMNWIDQSVAVGVAEEMQEEEQEKAQEETETIFRVMRESNFEAGLAMSLQSDGAVGTHAMLIRDPMKGKPARCTPVPIGDLEIDVCPVTGEVGARFLKKQCRSEDVPAVLHDVALDEAWLRKLKNAKEKMVCIRWGWWPLHGKEYEGDVHWQHVVMIDKEIVHDAVLKGEGSCELVVTRFNPNPGYAYGEGPAIKALPELRHLDDMAAGETEHIDLTLRPPMTFPDDSFSNIENGVEPAMFYPVRPGTGNDVRPMFQPQRIDAVLFDQQARERRVKRMFYNDMPEQRGDTPPTATQWVDEMAMAQRRIGTPGEQYWREGPLQIFQRFRYIARMRGLIKGEIGGRPLVASNPAKRAQDMQKASNAVRALQVGGSLFPEEFKVKVDGAKTMEKVFELMGANEVIVPRSQNDVQNAVSMIGQLTGGMQQGDLPPGTGGM